MKHATTSLALILFQLTTTASVVGFTSHRQSLVRSAALLPLVLLAYHQVFSVSEHIRNPVFRAFLGAASIFLVILYIDAALLSRWAFETQGPTSSLGGLAPRRIESCDQRKDARVTSQASFRKRLRFGFSIALQSRFPATPWAVPDLPPFSRHDPKYVPTRSSFLLRTTLKCVVYIFLLRTISGLGNPDENPVLFASDRAPLFRRLYYRGRGSITASELGTRAAAVLGYWTVQYVVIDLLYGLLALVAVGLGVTEVRGWVPAFGSVADARGVRLFWGRFYHQLIRQGCSSVAHYITYSVLRFRKERSSLAARYVFTTLVFTVSGVFHALSDVSQGIPLRESGAMYFFGTQALGIMLEDAFQAIASRAGSSKQNVQGKLEGILGRVCGHLWLLVWLAWTSPVWIYMSMQRDKGEPIIPF
ncbi:membrane bound O-acyl transferase family-domain-containing protein [Chaetomidium leptoderma]|uniref:Membrane bound O-acyl transferase family-domain-containing protein n=1 Tax=Chaetomidium leptoderma TaxID=669021 RepID=A0AAN6ZWU5_9PEZI|nr:membrane bound O-acyl transferase family-domain-containing protein [Chaetomidium leptoderma]